MSIRQRDYPEFCKELLAQHNKRWDAERPKLQMLNDAYMSEFYKNKRAFPSSMIQIEVPEAYSFVEGTLGSLFMSAPGVEIAGDISNSTADPDVAEAISNRFLQRKREIFEDAVRLALIFPNSFLKLAPKMTSDPLESVELCAVEPWNIVVDDIAYDWDNQRFVGHQYWMPVPEAKEKYPGRKFTGSYKEDYLKPYEQKRQDWMPEDFLYVCIFELYDLVNDKLIIYSQHSENPILSIVPIPLRNWDDTPLPAIVPLYFSNNPSKPLEGYSSLSRIYDQITEKNYARTRMANAVRREARQFLYQKDKIDDQALAGIATGQDGLMIPVEEDNLGALIQPVPNPNVNNDHSLYLAEIQSDLDRSSMLAPFARGQATQTTATEAMLLQAYTSSEIGRMARRRDTAIEALVNIYLRMLMIQLPEEQPVVITISDNPSLVLPEHLDGKLNIQVLDGASSPFESLQKKQALTSVAGLLVQLGADPQAVLEELVSVYKLPMKLAQKKEIAQPVRTEAVGQLSEEAISQLLGPAPGELPQ